ncbi:ATP-dependent DNA helicase [Syntrophomonas palmitatica]|uniref:ATP-dependent DNA helicase n=1 Tax=Syntrophomonas palmitatica TaxID=402877 RepID=UPI0006D1FEC6|nr:AAA family ATPase [Syntrophomonas palmitatica]
MITIDTLYGQIIGQEVKNQKTFFKFKINKDNVILLEGLEQCNIGDIITVTGKYNKAKTRFKVQNTPKNLEIIDDLEAIAKFTGITLTNDEYRACLNDLHADCFYTASGSLGNTETRIKFLTEHTGETGEKFVALSNFIANDADVYGLVSLFKDAGVNLGLSHALQIAYGFRNRTGYTNKRLIELVEECPWILSQILNPEEAEPAIEKLENYFNYTGRKLEIYRTAHTIIKILTHRMHDGDCFVPNTDLYGMVINKGHSKTSYEDAWHLLTKNQESKNRFAGIIPENEFLHEAIKDAGRKLNEKAKAAVYLPGIFGAEKNAAIRYHMINNSPGAALSSANMIKQAKQTAMALGKPLNNSQKKLIQSVCQNKITLLTGEAGTGKTHALKVLAQSYYHLTDRVPVVLAPTALAAYTAAENTIAESLAKTIHRFSFLFSDNSDIYTSQGNKSNTNQESPGLVIVDECSMLGPVLLRRLLEHITADTRLVFAGDPAQLPPIGADGTFTSMLRLADQDGIGCHIHLEENYRNDEGVISAARAILNNQPIPQDIKGVNIHICQQEGLYHKLEEILESTGGINPDTMILSPYRNKKYGMSLDFLNPNLAKKYGTGKQIPGTNFMIGDPVIAIRNDYRNGNPYSPKIIRSLRTTRDDVYNGMKGYIKEYNSNTHKVTVNFYTGLKGDKNYYAKELAYYLERCYALSIHKAQGGQAQNIVICLDNTTAIKNAPLIYTALTRCEKGGQVHIITKKDFLDAPYIKPVDPNDDVYGYIGNHCLTKFRQRVLALERETKCREY